MLRREKELHSGVEEDDWFVPGENTFYTKPEFPETPEIPDLVPNVRITLVEDPSLKASVPADGVDYDKSAAFSDKTYVIDSFWGFNWNGDIVGSYERLNDSAPHIHTWMFVSIFDFIWSYPRVFIDMEESITHFYIYNPDWSLVDEITLDLNNNTSTDHSLNFATGTYEWFITTEQQTKPEPEPEPEIPSVEYQVRTKLHLDIDLTDDCQYINVTHVNPVEGQDTFNFTVTAKGQNAAGKYVYDIHWWGWFKEYYRRESNGNTTLMLFEPSNTMLNLLSSDTENSNAEMACIGVISQKAQRISTSPRPSKPRRRSTWRSTRTSSSPT